MDCVQCKAANPDGNQFCGKCGTPLDGAINHLKALKEQKLASYEMTEEVLDRLLKWIKLAAAFVGIPLALVLGKGYYDLRGDIKKGQKVVQTAASDAKKDLSTTVSGAQKDLGTTVSGAQMDLATKVDQSKRDLDASVKGAKSEAETAKRDADISKQQLDASLGEAKKKAEAAKKEASSAEIEAQETERRFGALKDQLPALEAIANELKAQGAAIAEVKKGQEIDAERAKFIPALLSAQLVLSRNFVNQIKNRATINVEFSVSAYMRSPHRVLNGGDDGDLQMAGRTPEVGLTTVAEITNAGLPEQAAAVNLLRTTTPEKPIPVAGVWRIWFEHASAPQSQGEAVDEPPNSNPSHYFEIHPVTIFDSQFIAASSFVPIRDPRTGALYTAYAASRAFPVYEGLSASIIASPDALGISSGKAGYNHVEFLLEPIGRYQRGDDGLFVLADVYDVSDPRKRVTRSPRRMVFVDDTEPAKALQHLPQGEKMHVLGIPRVNLAELSAVEGSVATPNIDMALPYEIIVVAVLPDQRSR